MGWLFIFLLAAATLAYLRWTRRLSRLAMELAVAAIFVGIIGYAWQGSPNLAGAPAERATK